MDLINEPSFKLKYHKCKIRVKIWESEFKKSNRRNPLQEDIRVAPQKVRDAYKSYYKLKTLALQNMDISFTDGSENIGLLEKEDPVDERLGQESDNDVKQRVALAEIQTNDKNNIQNMNDDSNTINNDNTIAPKGNSVPEKSTELSCSDSFQDVWGVHLNKSLTKSNKDITKLHRRSSSFNFSDKLFVGSKFNKKNPRKSRSFSRPHKRNTLEGYPTSPSFDDSQDSQSFSQDFSHSFAQDSQDFSNPFSLSDSQICVEKKNVDFTAKEFSENNIKNDSSIINCEKTRTLACPILEEPLKTQNVNILESPVRERKEGIVNPEEKYKIISDTIPTSNQPVSAIHKALLTSHLKEKKLTPTRMIDKGWLERCTQVNTLEYQSKQMNDSGIASMESSTVIQQCSSREETPKNDNCSHNYMWKDNVSDSDDDIIENSEDECETGDQSFIGMKMLSFGTKRKLNLVSRNVHNTSVLTIPNKKPKNDTYNPEGTPTTYNSIVSAPKDTIVEIPSTVDMDRIAEAIVANEHKIPSKKQTASGKLSKKEIFEKKLASGQANDNFVRINIKKKVYVRGKKNRNFSKYKKAEWKKKKKMADAGMDDDGSSSILKCFKCGEVGHFAKNCFSFKGDKLLPEEDEEELDDSPFPTLEEVETMVSKTVYARRRKVLSSQLLMPHGDDQDVQAIDSLDTFVGNAVAPLYQLKENSDLIDTPPEVYEALEKFGHDGFLPGQEEAVMRILSGLSTLVTLATGGGKSLCYQLPAYMYSQQSKCITLVVSPLVSLMEDQVTGVSPCIQAACLHTNQTQQQRQKVIAAAKSGALDILLVSPEAVVSGEQASGFGSILRELPNIAFACIDEAHCVSHWSHNFRPSYLVICKVLREKLGVKTVLGLTATATKTTCSSIVKHLYIPDGEKGVIKDVPLPNNLVLSVSRDKLRDKALISLLQGERFKSCQSVIIYCTRRDECERLASLIRTCLQDRERPQENKRCRTSWIAEPYHAGLSATRRKQVQKAFMSGQLRIVVATVAFGMGINKQDIRAVIHYNMPRNFESYVQEVGRAGRDGLPAHCHLFLNSEGNDMNELRRHIYANSVDRHVIRKLLQRVFVPCKCVRIATLFEGVDFSVDVAETNSLKEIVNAVDQDENSVYRSTNQINCPGHEVAFSVSETVKALDLPQENISTMLCYLELHKKRWIKVMSSVYVMCKIMSYKGPKALKIAAKSCPPLAMAIALDQKRGISHDNSSKIEFPVVDIATAIGWDSGIVKRQLKNLEWKKVDDRWRRTGITVEFFELGFRVLAPGNLNPCELDEALDTLYDHVEIQEQSSLQQLKTVYDALTSVSYPDHTECMDDAENDRSEKLKALIRKYFEEEQLNTKAETKEEVLENEEQIASDVRSLVCMYRDNNFTARAVARIFHGIASPCYPAQIWGRCRYWRAHLDSNFKLISKVAAKQILRLK